MVRTCIKKVFLQRRVLNRWNRVRTLCDSSKKLSIVLEVSADLPSKAVMDRWLGEPVKAAVLPTDIFITNRKGFPVLSKAHQALVHSLLKVSISSSKLTCWYLLCIFFSWMSKLLFLGQITTRRDHSASTSSTWSIYGRPKNQLIMLRNLLRVTKITCNAPCRLA